MNAFRNLIALVLALAIGVVLSACGGGGSDGSSWPKSQGGNSASLVRAADVAAGTSALTADAVMDWMEGRYPQYFSPARQATQFSDPFHFRFYPSTYNHIGIWGADVYVLGPMSGDEVIKVGSFADITCELQSGTCTLPGASAAVFATPRSNGVTLAFSTPVQDGGTEILDYIGFCVGPGPTYHLGRGTASPIVVEGLNNGMGYNCTVSATNRVGQGPVSVSVPVIPGAEGAYSLCQLFPQFCPAPTVAPMAPQLSSVAARPGGALLTFAPAAGAAASEFIAFCIGPGSSYLLQRGTASPLVVTGMVPGVSYECNVSGVNSVGQGPPSVGQGVVAAAVPTPVAFMCQVLPHTCETPQPPQLSAVAPLFLGASLQFASAPGSAPANEYIGFCTGPGPTHLLGTATTSPVQVLGMTEGLQYDCTVSANNGGRQSAPSPPLGIVATKMTSLALKSDIGDYVGQGRTYSYTSANAVIQAYAVRAGIDINVFGAENWSISFQLPTPLDVLQKGVYTNLPGPWANAQGLARLAVSTRQCSASTTDLTVDDVTYVGGTLASLDMHFVYRCQAGGPALRGEIHWIAGP